MGSIVKSVTGAVGGLLGGGGAAPGGGGGMSMPAMDAGQMGGQYVFGQGYKNTGGFAAPKFQQDLIGAEQRFGPQYTGLELEDTNTWLQGLEAGRDNPEFRQLTEQLAAEEKQLADGKWRKSKGRKAKAALQKKIAETRTKLSNTKSTIDKATLGLLDQQDITTARAGLLQRREEELSKAQQRSSDVAALQEYAPQVVEAYRAADPYSTALAESQTAMAQDLYQRSKGLNPEQQRLADQQALGMAQAQGRINDQSSIAGQLLNRESYLSSLRNEASAQGLQAFNQNRAMAGDSGINLLGHQPGSASSIFGNQMLNQASTGASGPMGPSLFDPNMGVNMGMQERSNMMQMQAAQAQAGATQSAGMSGMLGQIGSSILGSKAGMAGMAKVGGMVASGAGAVASGAAAAGTAAMAFI